MSRKRIDRHRGARDGKEGAPAWVPVNAVHRIAKAVGVKVEEV